MSTMARSPIRAIATVAVSILFGAPAYAQGDAPAPKAIALDGMVKTPLHLGEADLRALPATPVSVSFMTGHGEEQGTFTGALLLALLDKASMIDGSEKGAHLKHVVLVSGHDGYAVSLSMGEIDPKFEGKPVIIAYDKDGKPLPTGEGLRLIVPGDRHGGRAVRDVERIEVK